MLEAEGEGEIIYQIQEDGEIHIGRDKLRRMGRDKLRRRERIFLEGMTSDRKLQASREGSKRRIYGS